MPIPQKLESYCIAFTDKLMAESFPKEGSISGSQILELCTIKQVNFFVIKNLLIQWKREMAELRSPYFDYGNKEVTKAMATFANILSRNIRISKKDFQPILYAAVKDAVSLMTTPYEYYMGFIQEAQEKKYSETEFREIEKYIKHNQFIYTDFVNHAVAKGLNTRDYPNIIEEVFNSTKDSPEDPSEHIKSFSSILSLDPALLSDTEPVEIPEKEETVTELASAKEDQTLSGDNSKTINDRLSEDTTKSVADVHQEKKIDDIRASLNLNQRFMFINGLFEGDEVKFNLTIEKLESLSTVEDARNYLNKEFNWDDELEEVSEFLELISKRLT